MRGGIISFTGLCIP